MIPLQDNNPTRTTPVLTWALIGACVLVFLWQIGGAVPYEQAIGTYGFIPARLFGATPETGGGYTFPTAAWTTLFTSMFMHGDIMHLGGNMLYLWIFGDNIENALGKVRFTLFYLLGGLAAAFMQGAIDPASQIPMIGASGAISGVLGAYLVLYPRQPITVLVPRYGITRMPALVVLGMWFVYQFLYGVLASSGEGGVAFWAHVGGFVAGVVMIKPFMLGRAPAKPRLWE